jgi:hypothetical protein
MLSYCYVILCIATEWLTERSDRLAMNTVTCPVEERTFCPYVLTRPGDNPTSRQNVTLPLPGYMWLKHLADPSHLSAADINNA